MSFADQVKQFGNSSMDKVDRVRRASSLELFRLIINSTPVDNGLLRNNWRTQVNSPNTEAHGSASKDGSGALSEAAGNLGELKDTLFFTNNLPYAERIEFDGWSKFKAPAGMVRKNVAQWAKIVAAKAREFL